MFKRLWFISVSATFIALILVLTSCNLPPTPTAELVGDMGGAAGAWIDAPLTGAEAPPGISIKVIGHVDPAVGQAVLYINGANSGMLPAPMPGKSPPAFEWEWNPEQPGVYDLRVGGADGPLSSSVRVTITGEMAFSAEFSADETSLRPGECTSLHWKTENASQVLLNGEEVKPEGDLGVCPQEDEEHVLQVEYKDKHSEELKVQLLLVPDTPTPTATYLRPTSTPTRTPTPTYVPTPDTIPPPAPVGMSPCGTRKSFPQIGPCTIVNLSWYPVSDPSGISQYMIVLTDVYTQQSTTYYTQSTSYGVPAGNSWYYWQVSAQDGAGNWGPACNECYFSCEIIG